MNIQVDGHFETKYIFFLIKKFEQYFFTPRPSPNPKNGVLGFFGNKIHMIKKFIIFWWGRFVLLGVRSEGLCTPALCRS